MYYIIHFLSSPPAGPAAAARGYIPCSMCLFNSLHHMYNYVYTYIYIYI